MAQERPIARAAWERTVRRGDSSLRDGLSIGGVGDDAERIINETVTKIVTASI